MTRSFCEGCRELEAPGSYSSLVAAFLFLTQLQLRVFLPDSSLITSFFAHRPAFLSKFLIAFHSIKPPNPPRTLISDKTASIYHRLTQFSTSVYFRVFRSNKSTFSGHKMRALISVLLINLVFGKVGRVDTPAQLSLAIDSSSHVPQSH